MEGMEKKGLRVNLSTTKLMFRGEGIIQTVGKWSCAVCGKDVGSNLI